MYQMLFWQIYIELFGTVEQPKIVPAKVYLRLRHLSGSYFRAGDNTIKQYRQSVGEYRTIKFDRFTISNETKCQENKKKGKKAGKDLTRSKISGNILKLRNSGKKITALVILLTKLHFFAGGTYIVTLHKKNDILPNSTKGLQDYSNKLYILPTTFLKEIQNDVGNFQRHSNDRRQMTMEISNVIFFFFANLKWPWEY